jgi:hypothetical protein
MFVVFFSHDDSDVVQTFLDSMNENGLLREYLLHSQIGFIWNDE